MGIVALAHVEQSRDRSGTLDVDRAKVVIADAVFAAAQCEDDCVLGCVGGELGEVVASRLGAVAAADHKEVLELAGLYGTDDLVGQPQDHTVVEADGRFLHRGIGQRLALLGALDHLREVIVGDSGAAGDRRCACGEDSVLVAVGRDQNAVGCGHDGAGEGAELAFLLLPGAAVVAGQVWILAQFGVHVGREHLAVGVDVDAGAGGLLEDVVEVEHVVPGHQDAGAGLGAFVDGGRRGLAECLDMSRVEEFHGAQILATTFEHELEQASHVEIDVGHGCEQGFLDEGVDPFIGHAQPARVMRIRGHSLEAVQQDFLQRLHIGIFSAHAGVDTSDAVECLLTLIAEHSVTPLVFPGGCCLNAWFSASVALSSGNLSTLQYHAARTDHDFVDRYGAGGAAMGLQHDL